MPIIDKLSVAVSTKLLIYIQRSERTMLLLKHPNRTQKHKNSFEDSHTLLCTVL